MLDNNSQIHGPVEVEKDQIFRGQIIGDATVVGGVKFVLYGQVSQNLFVELDSVVEVNGMVNGTVFNKGGTVEIHGIVGSVKDLASVAKTRIAPNAVVLDQNHIR